MAYAHMRSPQMVKFPIPYQKYLVEVGKRIGSRGRREYMEMELILPIQPVTQPPANPNKGVQVKEGEIDACMAVKGAGKAKKGKKKGNKAKKRSKRSKLDASLLKFQINQVMSAGGLNWKSFRSAVSHVNLVQKYFAQRYR